MLGNFCTLQGLSTHWDWVPHFIKGGEKSSSTKHENALEKISFCHSSSAEVGAGVVRRPVAKKMRMEVRERMGADCIGA